LYRARLAAFVRRCVNGRRRQKEKLKNNPMQRSSEKTVLRNFPMAFVKVSFRIFSDPLHSGANQSSGGPDMKLRRNTERIYEDPQVKYGRRVT
jgi:hypothetical protein